jgi:hypothetical protein
MDIGNEVRVIEVEELEVAPSEVEEIVVETTPARAQAAETD